MWWNLPAARALRGRSFKSLPGPQKYVKLPFRLFVVAWGYYFTYFWGPGKSEGGGFKSLAAFAMLRVEVRAFHAVGLFHALSLAQTPG